jgi:hypothetical protein
LTIGSLYLKKVVDYSVFNDFDLKNSFNISDGQWSLWSISGDCFPCGAGPNAGKQIRSSF